jgi:hypothetical protein
MSIGIEAAKSPNKIAGLRKVIQIVLIVFKFTVLKIVICNSLNHTGFLLSFEKVWLSSYINIFQPSFSS